MATSRHHCCYPTVARPELLRSGLCLEGKELGRGIWKLAVALSELGCFGPVPFPLGYGSKKVRLRSPSMSPTAASARIMGRLGWRLRWRSITR